MSHDLVFGLPHQSLRPWPTRLTKRRAQARPDCVLQLRPRAVDQRTGQRGYDEQDLPATRASETCTSWASSVSWSWATRRLAWTTSRCRPTTWRRLPRRFLAPQFHGLHLGQDPVDGGVGDVGHQRPWGGFAQNVKPWPSTRRGDEGGDSVFRGHMLHEEDLLCASTS